MKKLILSISNIVSLIKKLFGTGDFEEKMLDLDKLDKAVNDQITDSVTQVKETSSEEKITEEEKVVTRKKRGPYKKKEK